MQEDFKILIALTEMVQAMKKVAEMGVQLSTEERNLLSVAYKNVIGARRSSWRIISSIEQKEIDKNAAEERKNLIKKYREQVSFHFHLHFHYHFFIV